VTWVVVEEQKFVHAGIERERDHAAQRAVAPPDVLLVFLIRILRVEHNDVAAFEKLDHLGAFGSSEVASIVGTDPVLRCEFQLEQFVGLVVGHVSD